MNYSKQRELILNTLKTNPVHPTADELWTKLKRTDTHLSLATVYRNLNQLVELGLIRKITGLDSKDHFDYTLTPHDHFICVSCGRVQDVPSNFVSEARASVSEHLGKGTLVHEINFKGVCPTCRTAITKEKGE